MISILFENEDIVATNKPEGLASIPGAPGTGPSLFEQVSAGYTERLYVVHRLDKEASGLILFAKNAAAHRHLNEQFSRRQVDKTYLVLTFGAIAEEGGLIDRPLREFGSGRMGVDRQRGKPSTTRFEVMERLGAYSLVAAHPITGRRHQIRVHFYSLGHPVVGDRRYGDQNVQKNFPRLMLHARAITFRLPSGALLTIEAAAPESFNQVLAQIRAGTLT